MGASRNGARTYLTVIAKACKLSHLPGFRSGLTNILGSSEAVPILSAWDAFCALVELTISTDDWFNKKDATSPSPAGGEDVILV
jgi:hypothetical protein